MLGHDHSLSTDSISYGVGTTRGIVHSIIENGTARLLFDENCSHFWGHLITPMDESFSVSGSSSPASSPITEENVVDCQLLKDVQPSTSQTQMRVTIVDGETGDKFCIENVIVKMFTKIQDITNISQTLVEIDHPALKFRTDELLIGNRAAIEVQQYLNPNQKLWQTKTRSSQTEKSVHVGHMSLNLVTCETTKPTQRRVSMSFGDINCASDGIVEQTNDFLV